MSEENRPDLITALQESPKICFPDRVWARFRSEATEGSRLIVVVEFREDHDTNALESLRSIRAQLADLAACRVVTSALSKPFLEIDADLATLQALVGMTEVGRITSGEVEAEDASDAG